MDTPQSSQGLSLVISCTGTPPEPCVQVHPLIIFRGRFFKVGHLCFAARGARGEEKNPVENYQNGGGHVHCAPCFPTPDRKIIKARTCTLAPPVFVFDIRHNWKKMVRKRPEANRRCRTQRPWPARRRAPTPRQSAGVRSVRRVYSIASP